MMNQEQKRLYNKEYQRKMKKEKRKEYAKKYYQKNSERIRERVKKYYTTNVSTRPHIRRKAHLKLKFGILPEQYEQMLKNQNGGCAICGKKKTENGTSLPIDHCHETKVIRGILCHRCNIGLGYFGDDQSLLEKAIKYLNKYVPKQGHGDRESYKRSRK